MFGVLELFVERISDFGFRVFGREGLCLSFFGFLVFSISISGRWRYRSLCRIYGGFSCRRGIFRFSGDFAFLGGVYITELFNFLFIRIRFFSMFVFCLDRVGFFLFLIVKFCFRS